MNENQIKTTVYHCQLDFEAIHNKVKCIESLNPQDKGTENQFWFTTQMFVDIFGELRRTIERNIESLLNDEEISIDKNVHTEKIPAMDGKCYQTTIYNLEVLNKLGMCCFRGNKKAKEIRNAFNDVLVKHETNVQPVALPQTYIEALEALLESKKQEERTRLALEAEKQHVSEIQAGFEIVESRIQKEVFKQNAKAFSDLGIERKKTKRLESENVTLKTENEELKANLTEKTDQADFLKKKNEEQDQYIPTRYKTRYWIENFGHEPSPFDLAKYSRACDKEPIRKPLPSKIHGSIEVNFYHVRAWRLYEQFEWAHVSIKRPSLPF